MRWRLMVIVMMLAMTGCGDSGDDAPTAAQTTSTPSGDEELRGCVPACVAGLTNPGLVPAGEYQTAWFFGSRMILTLDRPWNVSEDSTGELSLSPADTPQNAVFLWEDVYPVVGGAPVEGVPMTANGLIEWFEGSADFAISNQGTGAIGTLPATIIDVRLSDVPNNEDPNCPTAVCRLFLGFPQWQSDWGITSEQVQRFYLADVEYGGVQHLLVAVIYPDVAADIDAFAPIAAALLATVEVPAAPA